MLPLFSIHSIRYNQKERMQYAAILRALSFRKRIEPVVAEENYLEVGYSIIQGHLKKQISEMAIFDKSLGISEKIKGFSDKKLIDKYIHGDILVEDPIPQTSYSAATTLPKLNDVDFITIPLQPSYVQRVYGLKTKKPYLIIYLTKPQDLSSTNVHIV